MAKGELYLGLSGAEQLLVGYGRQFSISDNEISRTQRTLSGRLVRDISAIKKEFTLAYDMIDSEELEFFLYLYSLESELSFQVWPTGDYGLTTTPSGSTDSYDQYTVLMDPIDRTRMLSTGDGVWSGVTVILREV